MNNQPIVFRLERRILWVSYKINSQKLFVSTVKQTAFLSGKLTPSQWLWLVCSAKFFQNRKHFFVIESGGRACELLIVVQVKDDTAGDTPDMIHPADTAPIY